MNANELADVIGCVGEDWGATLISNSTLKEAATMLRQQQAEIESMQERMIVAEKELNHMRSFFGCDPAYYGMTPAEPVAWMYQIHDITGWTWVIDQRLPDYEYKNEKPLYTHPAKTLTDEEMYQLASECGFNVDGKAINDGIETAADFHNELFDFARAILKKASEK